MVQFPQRKLAAVPGVLHIVTVLIIHETVFSRLLPAHISVSGARASVPGAAAGTGTSTPRPRSASHRSAAMAAMQPDPAAVTACRHSESTTSPAANTPSTSVSGMPGASLDVPGNFMQFDAALAALILHAGTRYSDMADRVNSPRTFNSHSSPAALSARAPRAAGSRSRLRRSPALGRRWCQSAR